MPLHGEAATRATYGDSLIPIGPGASETYTADHTILGSASSRRQSLSRRSYLTLLFCMSHACSRASITRPSPASMKRSSTRNVRRIVMVMSKVGAFDGGRVVLGQEPALSVGELLAVASDLLGALEHLHVTAAVLHRDLKPDNLRLSADRRRAWLIDLNMSGQIGPDGTVAGVATPLPVDGA